MEDDHQKALEEQIKAYTKLKKISNSDEFKEYFEFLIKITADKMLWAFTTGKNGDNIKNWDDFCKVRGEIIARLQPVQEIYGAESITKTLKDQLDNYYRSQ